MIYQILNWLTIYIHFYIEVHVISYDITSQLIPSTNSPVIEQQLRRAFTAMLSWIHIISLLILNWITTTMPLNMTKHYVNQLNNARKTLVHRQWQHASQWTWIKMTKDESVWYVENSLVHIPENICDMSNILIMHIAYT